MSTPDDTRQEAERILEVIEERGLDLPPEVSVSDVEAAIDPTVPFPVNLNRVLEQLVED